MTRYAVYYTFAPGPLAAFGAAWLGWDAATGTAPEPPAMLDLPRPRDEITATPRRYGLHATMKPPFQLAPDRDADALRAAFADFCAASAPARCDGLRLARMGGFLALRPEGDTGALDALAARVVAGLDGFRAAPDAAELARRRAGGLDPAQEANLLKWGYPYVMDSFRFHVTLTGRLRPDEAAQVEAALAPRLAPLLPRPFSVEALTLCGEAPDGRFHALMRVPLGCTGPGADAMKIG